MRLLLFTTRHDKSLSSFLRASEKYKVKTTVIDFADLRYQEGEIGYQEKVLKIRRTDKLLIRWPWDPTDTRKEYNFFVKCLVDTYPEQIILDKTCLADFTPFYEDKLFQSLIFSKLGIRTPQTWHFSSKSEIDTSILPFPLVMKKRISSRSKMTYRIATPSDLKRRIQKLSLHDFIFQEYIPFQYDLRLLFYKGKFLGTVERTPHVRANERLTVKGGRVFPLKNKKIVDDCLTYISYIGADFVGCDVLIGENGKYYLIEANLAPQFDKFEERTGVAVSEQILQESILS